MQTQPGQRLQLPPGAMLPKTEMRPGPSSEEQTIINGTQDVNIEKGAKTGMAFSDDKGIEIDTDRVIRTDQIEQEAFLNEMVTIQMADRPDENAHLFAEVTVNGQYYCLMTGEVYDIPRKHVAALAQAKGMRIEQQKIVNSDGSMGYKEKAVMRMMYPFSIIHDPNPKGARWLVQLMKDPS